MDQAHEKKTIHRNLYGFQNLYGPKPWKKTTQESKKIQNANHSCVDIKYYFKKIKIMSGVQTNSDKSENLYGFKSICTQAHEKKQSTENLYGFASIWTQAHEKKKQSKKSKKSKTWTLN